MVAVACAIERSDAVVITGNRLAIDDAGARAQAGQRLNDQRKAMRRPLVRQGTTAMVRDHIDHGVHAC
jgi:hypothetical protein